MARLPDPFGVVAEERRLADDLVQAVQASDPARCLNAVGALEYHRRPFARAMRNLAKLPPPSDDFRRSFLDLWLLRGEPLRDHVGNDLVLADGLRTLLPPYTGRALKLYRGDGAHIRRSRHYGLAWTLDIAVARHYAEKNQRATRDGGVVLETLAPRAAIICAPGLIDDRYAEREVLVDRRRLGVIKVIERLAPTEEARRLSAEHDKRLAALRAAAAADK